MLIISFWFYHQKEIITPNMNNISGWKFGSKQTGNFCKKLKSCIILTPWSKKILRISNESLAYLKNRKYNKLETELYFK